MWEKVHNLALAKNFFKKYSESRKESINYFLKMHTIMGKIYTNKRVTQKVPQDKTFILLFKQSRTRYVAPFEAADNFQGPQRDTQKYKGWGCGPHSYGWFSVLVAAIEEVSRLLVWDSKSLKCLRTMNTNGSQKSKNNWLKFQNSYHNDFSWLWHKN